MDDIERYENRLKFEHELINRRLTWLLTSQTILFAALALLLTTDVSPDAEKLSVYLKSLKNIISFLGKAISISILFGVLMGFMAKIMLWCDYNKEHPINERPLGVRTTISFLAFIPDVLIPLAFIIAWFKINDMLGPELLNVLLK